MSVQSYIFKVMIAFVSVLPITANAQDRPFPEILACMEALANQTTNEIRATGTQVNCPQTDLDGFPPRARHHRRDDIVKLIAPQGYKFQHNTTVSTALSHTDHCHGDDYQIISPNKIIGRYHCVSRGPVFSGGTDCNMTITATAVQDYLQLNPEKQQQLFERCKR